MLYQTIQAWSEQILPAWVLSMPHLEQTYFVHKWNIGTNDDRVNVFWYNWSAKKERSKKCTFILPRLLFNKDCHHTSREGALLLSRNEIIKRALVSNLKQQIVLLIENVLKNVAWSELFVKLQINLQICSLHCLLINTATPWTRATFVT